MAVRTYMRAFNGGEVSPSMYARIDDGKYQTGMALCKNFLVEPQGPITMRPGFGYVNAVKDENKAVNLIPFVFNLDQSMVLEFGEKYIRFHTQGQTLMKPDGEEPYEVETPYLADEVLDIHYVQSADVVTLVHPNHVPRELRRYGATDWRLVEISFSSTLYAPTGLKVEVHINDSVSNKEDYRREYAVTALDADGKNESIRSESVSVKCNPYGDGAYNVISWDAVEGAGRYRVYRNEGGIWGFIGESTETSIIDEGINIDASITPPNFDYPFSKGRSITTVTVVKGGSGYKTGEVTGINKNSNDLIATATACHYGSDYEEIGSMTEPPKFVVNSSTGSGCELEVTGCDLDNNWVDYSSGVTSVLSAQIRAQHIRIVNGGMGYTEHDTIEYVKGTGKFDYSFMSGGQNKELVFEFRAGNGYDDEPESWSNVTTTGDLQLVVKDATGSGAKLTPVVKDGVITAVTITDGGANYTDPTVTVKSSAGSGAEITAEVNPLGDYPTAVSYFEQRRWFGGTTQRPMNIWATKSGTESDMSYSMPTQDADRIAVRAAAREANRILHIVPLSQLILLTPSAEWRVTSLNSDAITPTSISIRPQSYVGASNVQPIVVNNQMLYAASRGGHLRECGYSYEAGGFISNDVSLRASHLFDNKALRSMAYSKSPWPTVWSVSSDGRLIAMTYVPEQQVGAFSTVETDGTFESCCVVPEGEEDVLYVTVKRNINGKGRRFVERMASRTFIRLEESMCMDCAGTYRGDPTTEINGLSWLEGAEVAIVADGGVEPRQKVKDGKISISHPASIVHVGLPYTADMKTLPTAMALQDGSYGSGHQKNVRQVWFRVVDSGGLKAGPDFENLAEYPSRNIEYAGSPPDPLSDEFGFEIPATWSASGQVCVRQDNPLPLRVISMTTMLEIV